MNLSSFRTRIISARNLMRVVPFQVLKDNYSYLVIDQKEKVAAVVDPVIDPLVLEQELRNQKVDLKYILATHHHWDHASGNKNIKNHFQSVKVYGGDSRIEALDELITTESPFKLGGLRVTPLKTPCHTSGHICYYVEDQEGGEKVVFTGDTLFIAGCGRFFEGTAKEMYDALIGKLSKLPDETEIYCGHEYTRKNVEFALTVDQDNQHLKRYFLEILNDSNSQTIPSTIGFEKKINPFMRVRELGNIVMNNSNGNPEEIDPVDVMKKLRELKDKF